MSEKITIINFSFRKRKESNFETKKKMVLFVSILLGIV